MQAEPIQIQACQTSGHDVAPVRPIFATSSDVFAELGRPSGRIVRPLSRALRTVARLVGLEEER